MSTPLHDRGPLERELTALKRLVAVVDGTGKVLDTAVVYPTFSERKKQEAIDVLSSHPRKSTAWSTSPSATVPPAGRRSR